jgi:hypothetical protein
MITREHYDIAIARLNELDHRIPYRPSDRITMSRLIKDEVEHWEQVIWDYESQQMRTDKEREVPPNS